MNKLRFSQGIPQVATFFDDFLHYNVHENGAIKPAVNILERSNEFMISLMAPGFEKGDFKIEIEKQTLHIGAEVKKEAELNEEKFHKKEFRLRSLKRSFALNNQIDLEGISANYEGGILHLKLPKKQQSPQTEAKLIQVQ